MFPVGGGLGPPQGKSFLRQHYHSDVKSEYLSLDSCNVTLFYALITHLLVWHHKLDPPPDSVIKD